MPKFQRVKCRIFRKRLVRGEEAKVYYRYPSRKREELGWKRGKRAWAFIVVPYCFVSILLLAFLAQC